MTLVSTQTDSGQQMIVQNPFMAMVETTFECKRCSLYSQRYVIRRLEPYTDLNLDLPTGGRWMGSEIKIKHLLDQNFKDEIIEDYMCIYCSLREYLFNYMKSDKNDPKLKDEILQKHMYPKWQISLGLSKQEASDFKDSL